VQDVHDGGGLVEAVLGVDHGIATYEGLSAALELFDRAYLFHDGGRTFHPKVYLVENDSETRAIIGSGNLTQGGLFTNYEAATCLDLDRAQVEDEALRQELRDYFDSFIQPGAPCRELDAQLVEDLKSASIIVTAAERTRTERQRRDRDVPALRRIFGASVTGLPAPPPVQRQRRTTTQRGTGTSGGGGLPVSPTTPLAPAPPSVPGTATAPSVIASWWKRLTPSDAMRKPQQSHQRNYVILGKARHPIDQKTFFKAHFFAGVNWTQQPMRTGRVKELALVPFAVDLDGVPLGTYDFRIDHNEERIANQNNSPTWLNWSSFTDQVRQHDLTDRYLLLERMSDGTFRMSITRSEPAPPTIPLTART
jgi:hypothetical protein